MRDRTSRVWLTAKGFCRLHATGREREGGGYGDDPSISQATGSHRLLGVARWENELGKVASRTEEGYVHL